MYYFSRINNDEKMSELNQECIQDLIEKDQPMPMKLKRLKYLHTFILLFYSDIIYK